MNLKNYDALLGLDYLVFSSHKSATQTVVNSLRLSGFNVRHCHVLNHIGLQKGEFLDYLAEYKLKNKKPLEIISIFREPIERLISSFFQSFGSDPIDFKEIPSEKETLIYIETINDLRAMFIERLIENKLPGFYESLGILSNELKIDVNGLEYNEEKQIGINVSENFHLHLIRFDHLISQLNSILSMITHRELKIINANLSEKKWYYDKYKNFKSSFYIPAHVIENIYNINKRFIDIFYNGRSKYLLNLTIEKFAKRPTMAGHGNISVIN